jgi:hypothetical protein
MKYSHHQKNTSGSRSGQRLISTTVILLNSLFLLGTIRVTTRYMAWLCGSWLDRIAGSNLARSIDVCLLRILSVVQVQASATKWSLVQGSPTSFVCVCVVSVIRWNNSPLQIKWIVRRGPNRKMKSGMTLILLALGVVKKPSYTTGLNYEPEVKRASFGLSEGASRLFVLEVEHRPLCLVNVKGFPGSPRFQATIHWVVQNRGGSSNRVSSMRRWVMYAKEGAACPQPAKNPQNITTASTGMSIVTYRSWRGTGMSTAKRVARCRITFINHNNIISFLLIVIFV